MHSTSSPSAIAGRSTLRRWLSYLGIYGQITLGAAMLAVSNDLFLIPNKVFSGGATGLSLVINSLVPALPVGVG
jgi:uncharacterized membrane-anchored protein YitT (DUF2179 family)